jgi:type I restriction enzyme S subunit
MHRGLPKIGDILFTMEAPLGNVALLDREDIALAQRVIKFRVDPTVALPKFMVYAVLGDWFQAQLSQRATGSTALGIKASKLPELRVMVPPLDAQRRLVERLDRETAQINGLIAKAEEFIALVRERRAALITEAATGRIDVLTGKAREGA